MHYYDHNIGDFAIETRGLTYEQIGIYISLLDKYASSQQPITDEWLDVAYQLETKCKALALLKAFFVKREGGFVHPRIEKQIAEFEELSKARREAGRKGGRKKSASATAAGDSVEKANESNCQANANITINHKPETINQDKDIDTRAKPARRPAQKLVKPEGVSDQVFDEWQALKRKLCKGCTQRMVDAIAREAEKAGMTVEQAMTYQLEKGWKGFEADWVRNAQPKKRPTDPQHGIGVCQPLPEEEVHWLTDEDRAESLRQMEAEGCAPF